MGGRRSGRQRGFSRKLTTEDYFALDTKWLKGGGYLSCLDNGLNYGAADAAWRYGSGEGDIYKALITVAAKKADGFAVLTLTHPSEWAFNARIEYAKANYGGTRYWLRCPECKTKVTKLYFRKDTAPWCRKCLGLRYKSQLQCTKWSLFDRARKIHLELGGDGDVTGDMPPRPFGMHYRTYKRKLKTMYELWEVGSSIRH